MGVEGKPSIKLAEKYQKEEEERERSQIEELGEQGLQDKEKELQATLDSQVTACLLFLSTSSSL